MSLDEIRQDRAAQLQLLHQTSRGTLMGTLLRKFWHPVALSREVSHPRARPIRIMGEDLTLYRGASGKPYLVGGRCAHRGTLLHPGWVEGETIRCVYHGWQYDGTGQCVQRPAERDAGLPKVKIAGYPLYEYGGLIFAYLGEGAAPAFELPRKDVIERKEGCTAARGERWPCNWLQVEENSLDAVHVSFVHQLGTVGQFGAAVTAAIPELSYSETEAGVEQVAMRSKDNVRTNDWTFPNNVRVISPGLEASDPWMDVISWNVPHDDQSTTRFIIRSTPATGEAAGRFMKYFGDQSPYNPADYHEELLLEGKFPPYPWLTSAQDYVSIAGQGAIADRADELLGRSDAGVVLLRNLFFREMELIRSGRPTKQWRRRPKDVVLPTQPGVIAEAL